MKHITIVGAGYVGLVTGACLAETGCKVTCMDSDVQKIEGLKKGIIPMYEPELNQLVNNNSHSGRLVFTEEMSEALKDSQIIFLAVGTPSDKDGSADLMHIRTAAADIAKYINKYSVIVIKSTVPVGTARAVGALVQSELDRLGNKAEFDMVSNPEFLREGAAVQDFMHPSRIVIGCESAKAETVMKDIYRFHSIEGIPLLFFNFETAELIKYASNAFLASKISFINEISKLCDCTGANVQQVAIAMGLDSRIGPDFLQAGPGYGGSCFPKDTAALVRMAEAYDVDMKIVKAVREVNELQKNRVVEKIERRLGELEGAYIGILGLAFKPDTDDVRDSPSLDVIRQLVDRGCIVRLYDPVAAKNMQALCPQGEKIIYCSSEGECSMGCDAIVLMTEWGRLCTLDFESLKTKMKQLNFFDMRNAYQPEKVRSFGFYYEGMGRS